MKEARVQKIIPLMLLEGGSEQVTDINLRKSGRIAASVIATLRGGGRNRKRGKQKICELTAGESEKDASSALSAAAADAKGTSRECPGACAGADTAKDEDGEVEERRASSDELQSAESIRWSIQEGTFSSGTIKDLKAVLHSAKRGVIVYASGSMSIMDMIVMSCKHNRFELVKVLLTEACGEIPFISFDETKTDSAGHTAYYYAIRTGNVKLLETLVGVAKESRNGFSESAVAAAFEELFIRCVPVSLEMETFVVYIALRTMNTQSRFIDTSTADVKKLAMVRIDVVLSAINILVTQYRAVEASVDQRFLFIARFLARNVYVLKRNLKALYRTVPWEEIEFCLEMFIVGHSKKMKLYNSVLTKVRLLYHLQNFASHLEIEKLALKRKKAKDLTQLPKSRVRYMTPEEARKMQSQFKDLHEDYDAIRDVYSLKTIATVVGRAITEDCTTTEAQLLCVRALQVVGECLKNTLESPKISEGTLSLLEALMPKNAQHLVKKLRDHLAHAMSVSDKQVEKVVWGGILDDLRKLHIATKHVLFRQQRQLFRNVLWNVCEEEDEYLLKEYASYLCILNLMTEIFEMCDKGRYTADLDKLEELLEELKRVLVPSKIQLGSTFDAVEGIVREEKGKVQEMTSQFLLILGNGSAMFIDNVDDLKFFKERVRESLPRLLERHIESDFFDRVWQLVGKINDLVSLCDIDDDARTTAHVICYKISILVNVKSQLMENLEELNDLSTPEERDDSSIEVTKKDLNARKFLKAILQKEQILNVSGKHRYFAKEPSQKSKFTIEASLLETLANLEKENNLLILDSNTPQVYGKELRNYLAHGNALAYILPASPEAAVLANAVTAAENIPFIQAERCAAKCSLPDMAELLQSSFDDGLARVSLQQEFHAALEQGDFARATELIDLGADIYGVGVDGSTSLHYAAKGRDTRMLRMLLDVMKVEELTETGRLDKKGQCPLHVAAAHGNQDAVRCLLQLDATCGRAKDLGGRTALHLACIHGREDNIRVLVDKLSDIEDLDAQGNMAIQYAIHKGVSVRVLEHIIRKFPRALTLKATQNFTCLQAAAEFGRLELVQFLLDHGADIHEGTVRNWTPIHAAAWNGHLEVATLLVSRGAHVTDEVLGNGCPLHFAVRRCGGQLEMTRLLLQSGADVNRLDSYGGNSVLHYAAGVGHEDILALLLSSEADVHLINNKGFTPLHVAAINGHVRAIKALVDSGADVGALDHKGMTPLYLALRSSQKEALLALIDAGADVNSCHGSTLFHPLHMATISGRRDIVKLLLLHGINVNVCSEPLNRSALHQAISGLSTDIVNDLINHGADINYCDSNGMTPLHLACFLGRSTMVNVLLKRGADAALKTSGTDFTCLHLAAINAHHRTVEELLRRGVGDVSAVSSKGHTALHSAVTSPSFSWNKGRSLRAETHADGKYQSNRSQRKAVHALIKAGADVNARDPNGRTPLLFAVWSNNRAMVQYLINNGADVRIPGTYDADLRSNDGLDEVMDQDHTAPGTSCQPLDIAAAQGYTEIVRILLASGAPVDGLSDKKTPLHSAMKRNLYGVAKCLVEAGADVTKADGVGGSTALHFAAHNRNSKLLGLLLEKRYKADVEIRDCDDRVALHLAIPDKECVRILVDHGADVNCKSGVNGWTALHVAAQEGDADLAKYLVDHGADLNIKNDLGSSALHIAAREGNLDVLKLFVSLGMDVNTRGAGGFTLVHYAVRTEKIEVLEYLISLRMGVNKLDHLGMTPLLHAASKGNEKAMEVLVKNGAIYDKGRFGVYVIHLLVRPSTRRLWATYKLFEAVRGNHPQQVEGLVKEEGAFADAMNIECFTPLALAASLGHVETADSLLRNSADPNIPAKGGYTPLHFAAQRGQQGMVRLLLCGAAQYDAVSASDKRLPVDLATEPSVTSLLKLVDRSFKKVESNDSSVLKDLRRLKDPELGKCVLRARNRRGENIFAVAVRSKFKKATELQHLLLEESLADMKDGSQCLDREDFAGAEFKLRRALDKREQVTGPCNLADITVVHELAWALYKQQKYDEALHAFKNVYDVCKKAFGADGSQTLGVYGNIALVLQRKGRCEDAWKIFDEIIPKLGNALGSDHKDTLGAMTHAGLVLADLQRLDKALIMNETVHKTYNRTLGPNHELTLTAKSNFTLVLLRQGKHDQACRSYRDILVRRECCLGRDHSDTMRTLFNIGCCLVKMRKFSEARETLEDALKRQESKLGRDDLDAIYTRHMLAQAYFGLEEFLKSCEMNSELLPEAIRKLGPNHPYVASIQQNIKLTSMFLNAQPMWGRTLRLRASYIEVIRSGDIDSLKTYLVSDRGLNLGDDCGRTMLHYAAEYGRVSILRYLLEKGGDAEKRTRRGNTPLHIASLKGRLECAEILLQHVHGRHAACVKTSFVNAKTHAGGMTSLHVAARNNHDKLVELLLRHGAMHDSVNANGDTPVSVTSSESVRQMLVEVEECFSLARQGNSEIIKSIKRALVDRRAVLRCRNRQNQTLVQLCLINNHDNLAASLRALTDSACDVEEVGIYNM